MSCVGGGVGRGVQQGTHTDTSIAASYLAGVLEGGGKTCFDGLDNDHDGKVDCADPVRRGHGNNVMGVRHGTMRLSLSWQCGPPPV